MKTLKDTKVEEVQKVQEVQEGQKLDPSHIMQVGLGFWASKTLLTAVKLELFTKLALRPLTAKEIKYEICLNDRGLFDFLDTLVALGFLQRSGIKNTLSIPIRKIPLFSSIRINYPMLEVSWKWLITDYTPSGVFLRKD
jgi:hypothetical protein